MERPNFVSPEYTPSKLSTVLRFVEMVNKKLAESQDCTLVLCVSPTTLFKSLFLLGAYKIISCRQSPSEVWDDIRTFDLLVRKQSGELDFELDIQTSLLAAWGAVAASFNLEWLDLYDIEEFMHYDNPLEGDIHWIIPEKLLAFACPTSLPPSQEYVDIKGQRFFSAQFYVEPFLDMQIASVIRLNESDAGSYDAGIFDAHGIHHTSLEFDEKEYPPLHLVVEFLHLLDRAADGAVAVHCRTGRGQAATMAAFYLMSKYGFSALEAVAWLRMARPGSVGPEHERFLCTVEAARRDMEAAAGAEAAVPAPPRAARATAKCVAAACDSARWALLAAAAIDDGCGGRPGDDALLGISGDDLNDPVAPPPRGACCSPAGPAAAPSPPAEGPSFAGAAAAAAGRCCSSPPPDCAPWPFPRGSASAPGGVRQRPESSYEYSPAGGAGDAGDRLGDCSAAEDRGRWGKLEPRARCCAGAAC